MLPGQDGLTLCRKIRSVPRGVGSVVVVVTGRTHSDALEEVLSAGANDYIAKPVDLGLLQVRLAVAEEAVANMGERMRTADELVAANRDLKNLFDNLDDVYYSIELPTRRLIQISPAASRLLGVPIERIREEPDIWRPLVYPDGQPDIDALLSPGRSYTRQYAVQRPDGDLRWVEASVMPEVDRDSMPIRIDGVITDVTDGRRAQDELAERNEELLTLVRMSEVSLTATELRLSLDQILEEVARATGFPICLAELHEPEQRRMIVLAAHGIEGSRGDEPWTMPLEETPSGRVVETGEPIVSRQVADRADLADARLLGLGLHTYMSFPMGGEKVFGALTLAHPEAIDPPRGLVRWGEILAAHLANVVERMRVEEAVKTSERRYRELAEQLQHANQELESFAYTVSHDLRAPLRTMQGFAHPLLQDFGSQLDPRARDYAKRIIASGQRSEILICDLLAYSRLSFEEITLQQVDLEAVLRTSLEELDGDLRRVGARVVAETPFSTVLGHQPTLVQVMTNLLSNATKFVKEGRKPEIRIWEEDRDPGLALVLTAPPTRVHRTNRHSVRVLDDLDHDVGWIASAPLLDRDDLDFVPGRGLRVYRAVHTLDLDRLARADPPCPREPLPFLAPARSIVAG